MKKARKKYLEASEIIKFTKSKVKISRDINKKELLELFKNERIKVHFDLVSGQSSEINSTTEFNIHGFSAGNSSFSDKTLIKSYRVNELSFANRFDNFVEVPIGHNEIEKIVFEIFPPIGNFEIRYNIG